MSVQGTVNRTLVLLALAFLSAAWVWSKFAAGDVAAVSTWIMAGAIGGLVLCLVDRVQADLGRVYRAALRAVRGLLLGGLSAFFEVQFPGIVIQSVALTFGTLLCMLALYSMRIVRATEKFKMGFLPPPERSRCFIGDDGAGVFRRPPAFFRGRGDAGIGISVFVVTWRPSIWCWISTSSSRGCAQGAQIHGVVRAFALLVTLVCSTWRSCGCFPSCAAETRRTPDPGAEMSLLIFYLLVVLSGSFLCSLLESVFLSVTPV
jgi:hypothetical protein